MQSAEIEPQNSAKRSDKRLGFYALCLLVFWLAVFVYTVHPALPANAIELPFEEKDPMGHLLPQGWAFFTRDPRTMDLSAVVRDSDGTWRAAASGRNWPHFLNFSRSWKLPGVEIGVVLSELTEPQWQKCEELPSVCLEKATSSGAVANKLSTRTLCGDVGIVRQEPVPWAWRESMDQTVMPSEVLRLQVNCNE